MSILTDEALHIEKLIHRIKVAPNGFMPKNFFKLTNFVRLEETDDYEIIAKRICFLVHIGFVKFSKTFAPVYNPDAITSEFTVDWERLNKSHESAKQDADYAWQMLMNNKVELRNITFSNLYNLVSNHIHKDHQTILAVTCYLYIQKRSQIPL